MISVAIVGVEVVLVGDGLAGSGDATKENPPETSHHMGIDPGRLESTEDRMMVPMCGHMGSPDPSHQVSHTAIEVEEGSGGHSDTRVIHNSLRLPTRGEPADVMKGNVFIVGPQIAEQGSRVVDGTEDVPGTGIIGIVMEKPRLKEREQHMPEPRSRIEKLRQVVLTKGLFKLRSNTGVNSI
jgi:hypothetical protein